jgi:hypothetical protein
VRVDFDRTVGKITLARGERQPIRENVSPLRL